MEVFAQLRADPDDAYELVVPTGSLYVEALPGAHAVLEDYKLFHRGIDAAKADSELRARELENLRYAMRLATADLEDPDIDKHVTFSGAIPPAVTDPDDA